MGFKAILNSKGEPQVAQIEIPIEGAGGELGKRAVMNLTEVINGLNRMETEQEVIAYYHIIRGFAACCELCGFLTKKSAYDLMHMVDHLVDSEIARSKAREKGGQE